MPLRDLTHPRSIQLKGVLFLLLGVLAAGLILAESPSPRTVALLAITIWAFCQAYYFAFYVIEHYIAAASAEPAMEESAIFDAVVDVVVKGDYDYYIYDLVPLGHALYYLSMAKVYDEWINKVTKLREDMREYEEMVSRLKMEQQTEQGTHALPGAHPVGFLPEMEVGDHDVLGQVDCQVAAQDADRHVAQVADEIHHRHHQSGEEL